MKRPNIKDANILAYVEQLEEELRNYKSEEAIVSLYLGVRKQVTDISELLFSFDMDLKSLSDKDDKIFDRYFKFLEKSQGLSETLVYLEGRVNPELLSRKEEELGVSSVEKHAYAGRDK